MREYECRIKTKNLSNTQKIEDFCEMYELLKNVDADDLKDDIFLNNDKVDKIDGSSSEDEN